MIIKFYNLGAIKETELDLRPLTVIIGPNNSNKTYIAYSVYGLLQEASRVLMPNLKSVKENESQIITIDERFYQSVASLCKDACEEFQDNFVTFYQDSSISLFKDTRFELESSFHETNNAIKSFASKRLNMNYSWEGGRRSYDVKFNNGVLEFIGVGADVQATQFEGYDYLAISSAIMHELFPKQFCLPAERNSLILTYKMLLNKRFSLMRDRERKVFGQREVQELQLRLLREQGDIRYPQPIEDFLDFLSDVELSHGHVTAAKTAQSNGQRNGTRGSSFAEVASQIEKYIQDGNKTSFRNTTLGGSEIMVNVNKGLSIDLYNASSSIKQLAPLLLYLRYRAAENQLLIIDEPEMNLHPESQVKLLEILAILVNAGVKVLLTTHSPYLMAHLNNLTLNENHSDSVKKKQATSLYLKDSRAFLSMDQVSAYEMRDNQLKSLKDEDFGIRYDTLSDVSVDVQQKYFEIYEKGKPAKRGKTQTTRSSDVS